MTDKFDAAIQEIAIKHGVVLSKDDPILILQTMNDRLLEESRQAQAAMLAQFREEMESISSQWKDDAREKADKVLNAALKGSKEVMSKLFQEASNDLSKTIKNIVAEGLDEGRDLSNQTRRSSRFAVFSSAAMLISSCIFMLLLLVQGLL